MAQGKAERRGLGRGLSALMADVDSAPVAEPSAPRKAEQVIDIARIAPNPDQPRRTFTEDALEELASSVREKGIIQPLILRVNPRDPNGFEIVAGERRWRAAQRAGLTSVPVVIKDVDVDAAFELALVENIQRQDLNPVEEAEAYQRLLELFPTRPDATAPPTPNGPFSSTRKARNSSISTRT